VQVEIRLVLFPLPRRWLAVFPGVLRSPRMPGIGTIEPLSIDY